METKKIIKIQHKKATLQKKSALTVFCILKLGETFGIRFVVFFQCFSFLSKLQQKKTKAKDEVFFLEN